MQSCGCSCHGWSESGIRYQTHVQVVDKKPSLKQRVLSMFQFDRESLGPSILTAIDLKWRFGSGVKLSSLSSTLNKMVKAGELNRAPKFGVRGGYGYYVPYKASKPRLR
jgi:hypothetical protein